MSDNPAPDGKVAEGGVGTEHPAVAFLIPAYKTPYMTADLLSAALSCAKFDGCTFVLLLDAQDPHLQQYKTLVENVRAKGLSAGFFVFDGTPYCGMVNRVAPLVRADCVCVLDSTHLPLIDDERPFAVCVREWLAGTPEPMRVGTFVEEGFYPLVTRKLIDRLGYMFHPLAYGRLEAEDWLLSVAVGLGVVSGLPKAKLVESVVDGVEIIGMSDENDKRWVNETLEQALDDEVERLSAYLIR